MYAASEGLDVLVLEAAAPGGQAAASSKIENYLGFPTGISGQALSGRALTQAEKFGAKLAVTRRVVRLRCDAGLVGVDLAGGELPITYEALAEGVPGTAVVERVLEVVEGPRITPSQDLRRGVA